jgi:hypothetical protein
MVFKVWNLSVNLLESDIIATITVIMSKGQYSLVPAPVFACACACACALIFVNLILSS